MRAAYVPAAVLAVLALSGCGQRGGAAAADPGRIFPISDKAVEARLPGVIEEVLPNGLSLMILEDHRLPTVTFRMVVPGAGGCFDPEGKEGLAGFTASLMSAGTRRLDRQGIAREMERTAASVRISAGPSATDADIEGDCLAEYFPEILRLTAELVLEPTFPEPELDQTRSLALASLAQQRSDPNFLAREKILKALYGGHPGSRLAIDPAAVKRISRSDLLAFHRSRYVPDHAVLGIAGDITPESVRRIVAEGLGTWKRAGSAKPVPPALGPAAPAGIHLIHRPLSVQTVFCVGVRGAGRMDPDFLRLSFLNQILGSNSSRRLFQNLRERHAYTYGCYSFLTFPDYPGAWMARTEVRNDVTGEALKEILGEMKRARTEPVPDDEMRAVKRMTAGEYALSMESLANVLDKHLALRRNGFPADYWDFHSAGIMAATPAEVMETAVKYLSPGSVQIVAVGDAARIAAVLRTFGTTEIVDTEGRPLAGF